MSTKNKDLFSDSELDWIFEIARMALADAVIYDNMVDAMDGDDSEVNHPSLKEGAC